MEDGILIGKPAGFSVLPVRDKFSPPSWGSMKAGSWRREGRDMEELDR